MFPHTTREAAFQCAERIRKAVAKTAITVDGVTVKVTISIGVAQMTDARGDWSALLKQAGEALYAAKAAGRDCVK